MSETLDPGFAALAHTLADAAAPVAMRHFRTPLTTETKDDASPVTRADRESEAAMRALIDEAFPEHGILGEEYGPERTDAEYVWVLDPIDGTRAFINGIPLFATLIALVRDGVPVLGLNSYPALDERWLATADTPTLHWGLGNEGAPVQVAGCASLSAARMCTTSQDMFNEPDLARYLSLKGGVADTRFGTDAYAYVMVASGHCDLVAESGMQPYDYLSHAVIVEGAGGVITDWEGKPLRIDSTGSVLAAGDAQVHAAALEALKTS